MTNTRKYRTMPEVVDMLRQAGFGVRQARIGAAISMCEAPVFGAEVPTSDFGMIGDLDLVDETWDASYGGFQIRALKEDTGTGSFRDKDELLKPRFNVWATRSLYKQSGWRPWATYTSGMYKAYLPDLFPPPKNTYVVMAGDTLGSIASDYDTTWQELARINNLHSPYTIFIGQEILYRDE